MMVALAVACIELVKVLVEKYVPQKQMPTFRRVGINFTGKTIEQIAKIGRKKKIV